MSTTLDSSYVGVSNIDSIPAEQRIYDRTSEILKITKGKIPALRVMINNFQRGGKKAVTDIEFKYKSDVPRQALVDIAANSDSYLGGTENRIWIPDAQAVYIEKDAILLRRDGYYNGSSYTTTIASGNTARERIRVLTKGTSDGTKTWFAVRRGFGKVLGTPDNIGTSEKLILLTKSQAEGNNEGGVYGDTPQLS